MSNIDLKSIHVHNINGQWINLDQEWIMINPPKNYKPEEIPQGIPKVHPNGMIQIGTELMDQISFIQNYKPKQQ